MSNIDVAIEVPQELTDAMEVLTTVMSPVIEDVGVLIMGEHFYQHHGSDMPTIRLYLLTKSDSKFVVDSELEAFAFHDFETAQSFLARLPEMTALELLMLMNGRQLDVEDEGVTYH